MIVDTLESIVSFLAAFVAQLSSLFIIPNVSLLSFLLMISVLIIVIGAFILRV